eukprot:TRINITY_DN8374_c0_g2_i2.p1 TRINITY_DN8374_c0_g2~~TRINITY_DN8374_c0_g2_i2.p1  ORF type:complete len:627 (-),score=125.50 TRINITY_DN8374_c0_g2_i2:58-1851(-)
MYPKDVCDYLERTPLDVVVEIPADMYTGRNGEVVCCDIRKGHMVQYYKGKESETSVKIAQVLSSGDMIVQSKSPLTPTLFDPEALVPPIPDCVSGLFILEGLKVSNLRASGDFYIVITTSWSVSETKTEQQSYVHCYNWKADAPKEGKERDVKEGKEKEKERDGSSKRRFEKMIKGDKAKSEKKPKGQKSPVKSRGRKSSSKETGEGTKLGGSRKRKQIAGIHVEAKHTEDDDKKEDDSGETKKARGEEDVRVDYIEWLDQFKFHLKRVRPEANTITFSLFMTDGELRGIAKMSIVSLLETTDVKINCYPLHNEDSKRSSVTPLLLPRLEFTSRWVSYEVSEFGSGYDEEMYSFPNSGISLKKPTTYLPRLSALSRSASSNRLYYSSGSETSSLIYSLSATPSSQFALKNNKNKNKNKNKNTKRSPKIAIVGAGYSGIAVAREIAENGGTPILIEESYKPGGIWIYDDDPNTVSGYHSLFAQGAAADANLRGWVIPYDAPRALSIHQISSHLKGFWDHFGISKYVVYNTHVTDVVPLWGNKKIGNNWMLPMLVNTERETERESEDGSVNVTEHQERLPQFRVHYNRTITNVRNKHRY